MQRSANGSKLGAGYEQVYAILFTLVNRNGTILLITHISLNCTGMLASTALISRIPNPVCVLLCFGLRGGSTMLGGGGVATGGFDMF